MVVVVKSKVCIGVSNTTASHLYMKYNGASLQNLQEWRNKLFVKTRGGYGGGKGNPSQGEKGEKGEKEIKNQTLEKEYAYDKKDEKKINLSLDVDKVINNLSVHLEKIHSTEKKQKTIDKKKGKIIYNTKDGRVLQAFHSCEQGKIIWDDNVYDDLKSWLSAASIAAPSPCIS